MLDVSNSIYLLYCGWAIWIYSSSHYIFMYFLQFHKQTLDSWRFSLNLQHKHSISEWANDWKLSSLYTDSKFPIFRINGWLTTPSSLCDCIMKTRNTARIHCSIRRHPIPPNHPKFTYLILNHRIRHTHTHTCWLNNFNYYLFIVLKRKGKESHNWMKDTNNMRAYVYS